MVTVVPLERSLVELEQVGVPLLAGERQEAESYRAAEACNTYLRLGP